jgi:hydroxymethylbilane synthase
MRPLKLGTRGSPLALAQARLVVDALRKKHHLGAEAVEIVTVTTTGDRVQDRPLAEIGGKYLWTKELDRALGTGEVDCCVHSLKDVESQRPDAITIAAVLPRGDVRDRLIGSDSFQSLRIGARIGSSSPRRTAQILRLRRDITIEPLRGNVATRIRAVADGTVDGTLLAAAGLDRLGIADGVALEPDNFLPAPGQAAIAVECRADDKGALEMLSAIDDPETHYCVLAERAFTRALGPSCSSPVAALASLQGETLSLRVQLFSADGADVVEDCVRFEQADLETPRALAGQMLSRAPKSIRTLFEGT